MSVCLYVPCHYNKNITVYTHLYDNQALHTSTTDLAFFMSAVKLAAPRLQN